MKKLLLHICCAPCGAYVVEKLKKKYSITLFFYNSNIDTLDEYSKRLLEVVKLAKIYNLPLIIKNYNHASWLKRIKGLEKEPEKGLRCFSCYEQRLKKTAAIAKEKKFDIFSTTLTISPYKNSEKINEIGNKTGIKNEIEFLEQKFDRNDYQQSVELAKKHNFYRQKYCGCEF
jgi:hypothetical protein